MLSTLGKKDPRRGGGTSERLTSTPFIELQKVGEGIASLREKRHGNSETYPAEITGGRRSQNERNSVIGDTPLARYENKVMTATPASISIAPGRRSAKNRS